MDKSVQLSSNMRVKTDALDVIQIWTNRMSEKQDDGPEFELPFQIRERYKKLTEDESFRER